MSVRFAQLLCIILVVFVGFATARPQADWTGSGSYLDAMGGGNSYGSYFQSNNNMGGGYNNWLGNGLFGR
ncbi:hypothetical protein M3Y98_01100700 [Aphelenchoides besseyi]|nr:hypothetical protein M3Y98_01100700 [Aphelenchoides besseyi]KAI6209320.1 hypothetical protein M3Y96_00209300 [Aphelenchoides besseyi]